MSKPSDRTLTWWLARFSRLLIIIVVIGYASFGVLLLIDQTNLLGLRDTLSFSGKAIIPGLLAVAASLLASVIGSIGIIYNIFTKTDLYLRTFLVNITLPVLIIPFNFIWLSFYGY